jgi:hypothetical protein
MGQIVDNNETTKDLSAIAELKVKKHHLNQRLTIIRFTWWGWLGAVLAGGILFGAIGGLFTYNSLSKNPDLYHALQESRAALGAFIGAALYGYSIDFVRWSIFSRLRRVEYDLVMLGTEELKDNIEENFFTKLVQINFKYLDQYYLQTQEQADKSFRLSSFASISGMLVIVCGICFMYFDKINPAYVTTAAGLISEFIAAVFFYLYNKTILKMSQYHQKLVITQNISLALKITDEMQPEQKAKSFDILIDRLTIDVNKYLTGSD